MPNLDKTGPQGKGPKTGRGLGPCNKQNLQNFSKGLGKGARRRQEKGCGFFGRMFGRGRNQID